MISPITLCNLSGVCKSFHKEFIKNTYWNPILIRDLRNGVKYKREHKDCRKMYMNKIVKKNIETFYNPKIQKFQEQLRHSKNHLLCNQKNVPIYKFYMQKVITSLHFNNKHYRYQVQGLYKYDRYRDSTVTPLLPCHTIYTFDDLYTFYRRYHSSMKYLEKRIPIAENELKEIQNSYDNKINNITNCY